MRTTRSICTRLLVGLLHASPAAATVHHVPAQYPTMQAGVDAAQPGDTVAVAAGYYFEPTLIASKGISLLGAGSESTTVDVTYYASYAVTVRDAPGRTTIEGFSFRGGGILVERSGDVQVAFCCITRCRSGISVIGGSAAVIRFNRIHATTEDAVLGRASRLELHGNLIYDNSDGNGAIVALVDSRSTLTHNTLLYNRPSQGVGTVTTWGGDSVVLLDNVIAFGNHYAVSLRDSLYYRIEHNDVYGNLGYRTVNWTAPIGSSPTNIRADPQLTFPDYLPPPGSPLVGAGSGGSDIGIEAAVTACAVPPPASVCGNGIREGFERCDDGNLECDDGCDKSCRKESPDCSVRRPGDINGVCLVTAADLIYLINFVFKDGPDPLPCKAAADVNCSGSVTSADIIFLIGFLFKGGPHPCDACDSPLIALCP